MEKILEWLEKVLRWLEKIFSSSSLKIFGHHYQFWSGIIVLGNGRITLLKLLAKIFPALPALSSVIAPVHFFSGDGKWYLQMWLRSVIFYWCPFIFRFFFTSVGSLKSEPTVVKKNLDIKGHLLFPAMFFSRFSLRFSD